VRSAARAGALLLLAAGLASAALLASAAGQGPVNVVTISGSINPASSDYIQRAIAQSEEEGARALLIELDTPGGLLSSTKDIIQAILNARVPVIVFVSPRGAWAASAGTFITMAGHVAAMAPGTSIGAAHPVGIGGGGGEKDEEGKSRDFAAEKIENFTATFIESIARERKRNTEWAIQAVRESVSVGQDEALKLNVIDLVAQDREDLFRQLEGREVQVKGQAQTLALADAPVRELEMSLINRFIDVLASPDVAVLLILAGLAGLYFELQQPGMIVPGAVGAVCLILGFIALQILPFSWLGLLLMLLGVTMLVAEAFVTSYGLLFAGGLLLFLLGGSMIFDMPAVSDLDVSFWSVLVPAAGGFALFAGLVILAVGRVIRRPQVSGVGELMGQVGTAVTPLEPEGTVFVRGEHWKARAESPLAQGERVEVTAVHDLTLRVRRAEPLD
jgi:membrane-bound serine protease (ClpP class)